MERYLTQEDRIRRAEEIYYKRNNLNKGKTTTVNIIPKKEYRLLKRIIIQLIICAGIYFAIYNLQSNTDALSIDSISYIKSMLKYDADINYWISNTKEILKKWYLTNDNKIKENIQDEGLLTNAIENENIVDEQETTYEQETLEAQTELNQEVVQDTSSKSKMEQDADYIKANYSLIKPITGTITSRFGPRNPTTPTVPKYHTGIDIAVNEGTVFVASMDGTVELVSSEGDYR